MTTVAPAPDRGGVAELLVAEAVAIKMLGAGVLNTTDIATQAVTTSYPKPVVGQLIATYNRTHPARARTAQQ